jgi:hypothetical protein
VCLDCKIWSKIEKLGLFQVKKVDIEPYILYSKPGQSKRTCPKILKICRITKFDMGFSKSTLREVDLKRRFFLRDFLRQSHLICFK